MADVASMVREHGFHALTVVELRQETADTVTIVVDVPEALREVFRYEAGQFCNVRIHLGDDEVIRCYSMSSAPSTDDRLAVTVKRVPGGVMSNWLPDHLEVGGTLEMMKPSGVFVAAESAGPVIGFCGGSGVTPVYSITKHVLATTGRSVRWLYANRDASSVIFADALAALAQQHPGRLEVRHHLDSDAGYLTPAAIAAFVQAGPAGDVYVCGPGPFMDVVEAGLAEAGVPRDAVRIERFTSPAEAAAAADAAPSAPAAGGDAADDGLPSELTVILKKKRHTIEYRAGDTVLDTARRGGLKPPYSCELGNCATCMALCVEGGATMRANTALTPAEVAEGWVLTCQAVPNTPTLTVEYENM